MLYTQQSVCCRLTSLRLACDCERVYSGGNLSSTLDQVVNFKPTLTHSPTLPALTIKERLFTQCLIPLKQIVGKNFVILHRRLLQGNFAMGLTIAASTASLKLHGAVHSVVRCHYLTSKLLVAPLYVTVLTSDMLSTLGCALKLNECALYEAHSRVGAQWSKL